MDPISLIITALASGAAAAVKPTAENVVKDAYQGLKTIIKDRYSRASSSVDGLELRPDSDARKNVVKEELGETDAVADADLLRRAQEVLSAVEKHDPSAANNAAIDLETIRIGANLNIEDVVAEGTAVRIRDAQVDKDVNLKGIRSGGQGKKPGS